MERVFRLGKAHGKQFRERGVRPAAIAQRRAPAQKQHAAPAPVDEIANQLLLLGRKISGFRAADDEPVESEQFLGLRRKSVQQFLGILNALTINLVLCSAHHRGQLQTAIVFDAAMNEFVFPAGLTLKIKDARLSGRYIHQARHAIIL